MHLRTISDVAPTLPSTFATRLVLPSLLSPLELPAMAHQASAIIPVAIILGKNVPSEDYNKIVLEPILKLFSSSDRGTRMALLDALPEIAPRLDKKLVSDKIWPHLVRITSRSLLFYTHIISDAANWIFRYHCFNTRSDSQVNRSSVRQGSYMPAQPQIYTDLDLVH